MKFNEVKIIINLLERNNSPSIRQLAKDLKKDYKNTYQLIKELEQKNIIKLEKFGNASKIILIRKINPLIFQAEYERAQKILKNKDLSVIIDQFKKDITEKQYTFLLFGSYAKGTETKNSYIDLMFIVRKSSEKNLEKQINQIKDMFNVEIHALIFNDEQFTKMIQSRNSNVCKEAEKERIILKSIENYYGLAYDS